MPRTCSVCAHSERYEVDSALVAGTPYRDIAGRFGLSRNAVARHVSNHLALAKVREVEGVERATSLSGRLEELYNRAEAILAQAEEVGRHNVSLASIRELRAILELAFKLAAMSAAREPTRIDLRFEDGTPVPNHWGV